MNSFDKAPSFGAFPTPKPGAGEVLVKVSAVAAPVVVRAAAAGKLYAPKLPFVPGLDGVGHIADGFSKRVYFAFPSPPNGTLAEFVVLPQSKVIPLPDSLSDVEAAALANPLMSCWLPLTRRTQLKRGETVLINGATGVAGRIAVQIAKHLGAGRIIATGRNQQRLEEAKSLGADEVLALNGSTEEMVNRGVVCLWVLCGVSPYSRAVRAVSLVSCSAALARFSSSSVHCFSLRWCSRERSTSAPSVASTCH